MSPYWSLYNDWLWLKKNIVGWKFELYMRGWRYAYEAAIVILHILYSNYIPLKNIESWRVDSSSANRGDLFSFTCIHLYYVH